MSDKKLPKNDAPPAPAPKAHEVPVSTFDFDKPPDETGTTGDSGGRPPGSSDTVVPEKQTTSTVRAYAAEKQVLAAALLPFVGGGDIDRPIDLEKLDKALEQMEGV